MKIIKHIGYRFLTDQNVPVQMMRETYPMYNGTPEHPLHSKAMALVMLLTNEEQDRTFVISTPVLQSFQQLNVTPTEAATYDWSVFRNLTARKVTFLYMDSHQGVLRIAVTEKHICCASLRKEETVADGRIKLQWVLFFINRETNQIAENWGGPEVMPVEEFAYRLMCSLYLTDNHEYVDVPSKGRYGTRKSGKVVNDLDTQISFVIPLPVAHNK